MNKATGIEYTKNNASILIQAQQEKGYRVNEWVTFLQAKELGQKVKKGEKGTHLVRVFDAEKTDTAGELKKAVRHFVVFNVEQLEPLQVA